jgi:type IV secretion system protein TrbL
MANTLVSQFTGAVGGIYGAILPIAQNLFILLAAITVTWSLIWWILEKDDPVPIFVGLLKNLMRISFFWFVLLNAQGLARAVLNSFVGAGQAAASAAGAPMAQLSPVGILQAGSGLAETLVQNLNVQGMLGSIAGAFLAPILGVLLFVAFLIIAAQMVIALVEGFIVLSGGVLLLGFLGSPWTARFGMSYFSALLGVGTKLFMIYIIVALGGGLVTGWQAAMTGGVNLSGAFSILGVCALFSFIAWSIPSYGQALASGAVSASLNSVLTSAAGIATAASGARAPLALVARASSAVSQGIALGRDRYGAGAGVLRAAGAGAGHVLASPFRAAANNLATRHSYRHVGAADVVRRERGV